MPGITPRGEQTDCRGGKAHSLPALVELRLACLDVLGLNIHLQEIPRRPNCVAIAVLHERLLEEGSDA